MFWNVCPRKHFIEKPAFLAKILLKHWFRESRMKNIKKSEAKQDMIGYYGLNCEKCDAYIATKNNDDALREKTAKLWSELNHTNILPKHINCTGCRTDGVKTVFCESICAVRKCAMQKGFATCGDCPEMEKCPTLGTIVANNPDILKNLKSS